jgi:hypothetical protein
MTQTSGRPLGCCAWPYRAREKAILLPFGDQIGYADSRLRVNLRSPLASAFIT